MDDFERLGVFYLGREYDLEGKGLKDSLLLYDSRDLVTHAVCVGMTGSGKTGLCIGLLEEAAIDGIPAIVVDPKGDLANLLLTFPDLKPDDFLPWVNAEDAARKNLTPGEYAGKQADLWKKGLSEWGQDSSRIRRLRDSADFVIYTPGSSAGIPVSILKSFETPEQAVLQDTDLLNERINTTVTGLLNLMGIEADPIQSREHILLSTILDVSWKQGLDMDLQRFIQTINTPPFTAVGVFDLESFFPAKERFSLAMKLNNLLAAPGFQAWLEGEDLDVSRLLYTDQGKPKVSVFSIAHLSDGERMFFVSLLLTQVLGWMRTQSGTTSLRALFYMDEIFGYFPPVANPPSKGPLLTLLKQARAFGLGVVLATQNPVDLDYKGLSNTGTWFIGRLQTDRDKQRVLDGLEGAGSSSRGRFDRGRIEQILSGLGSRVFLMNNVHEDEPVIFQTRWVMSYLRGPLTRDQIRMLMDPVKESLGKQVREPQTPDPGTAPAAPSSGAAGGSRPMLPPGIPEYFIPVQGPAPDGSELYYEPELLGMGKVYYADARAGIAAEEPVSLLAPFTSRSGRTDWDDAREAGFGEDLLESLPEEGASFSDLPPVAGQKNNYSRWGTDLRNWLYLNHRLDLFRSPSLSLVSGPGEAEREFRVRAQLAAREKRDMLVEDLRKKYSAKIDAFQERIRRAEQALEKEKEQAGQEKLKTAISFGATIFSALLGRKKLSHSSLGRAATTARGAGRILKEGKDVDRAEENLQELQEQLEELQTRLREETDKITRTIDPLSEDLETFILKPKKKDILVSLVALAWLPCWRDSRGKITRAW
ncbi:MAG: ATP-binding protein [Nitrospiraceae bacterium]|nr:MAG: ATP-binding protein [Nitrospiraceae bacterium]